MVETYRTDNGTEIVIDEDNREIRFDGEVVEPFGNLSRTTRHQYWDGKIERVDD